MATPAPEQQALIAAAVHRSNMEQQLDGFMVRDVFLTVIFIDGGTFNGRILKKFSSGADSPFGYRYLLSAGVMFWLRNVYDIDGTTIYVLE